jgi:hypothetical protein
MEFDETEWRKKFEGPSPSRRDHELLQAIKTNLESIDGLAAKLSWEEDGVYRYYSQSFKVFGLQNLIEQALAIFQHVAPDGTQLNDSFVSTCQTALEHRFSFERTKFDMDEMNANWQAWTRPILVAFWHCSYFLRMMARYGRELEEPSKVMPSGWAAIRGLYGLW